MRLALMSRHTKISRPQAASSVVYAVTGDGGGGAVAAPARDSAIEFVVDAKLCVSHSCDGRSSIVLATIELLERRPSVPLASRRAERREGSTARASEDRRSDALASLGCASTASLSCSHRRLASSAHAVDEACRWRKAKQRVCHCLLSNAPGVRYRNRSQGQACRSRSRVHALPQPAPCTACSHARTSC